LIYIGDLTAEIYNKYKLDLPPLPNIGDIVRENRNWIITWYDSNGQVILNKSVGVKQDIEAPELFSLTTEELTNLNGTPMTTIVIFITVIMIIALAIFVGAIYSPTAGFNIFLTGIALASLIHPVFLIPAILVVIYFIIRLIVKFVTS